jgi:hypothetical protein
MSESVCVSGRDLFEKRVGRRGEEGSGARSDWRLCLGAPRNLDGRFGDIDEHSNRIRINDALERLNREISRRTKVVGNFSDGQSALNLSLLPQRDGERYGTVANTGSITSIQPIREAIHKDHFLQIISNQ